MIQCNEFLVSLDQIVNFYNNLFHICPSEWL